MDVAAGLWNRTQESTEVGEYFGIYFLSFIEGQLTNKICEVFKVCNVVTMCGHTVCSRHRVD